jgi:hypothetical protein
MIVTGGSGGMAREGNIKSNFQITIGGENRGRSRLSRLADRDVTIRLSSTPAQTARDSHFSAAPTIPAVVSKRNGKTKAADAA